jgi:hypothetical protein
MQQWWPFPKRITKLPLFLSVEKQQQHTIRSSAISQRRDNYRQQHTEHTHSPQPTLVGWSGEREKTRKKQTLPRTNNNHQDTRKLETPKKIRTRVSERECRS